MKNTVKKTGIVTFCLLAFLGCYSAPERPVSDHYDGDIFYNPSYPKAFAPSMSDAVRLMFDKRSTWPDSVENLATPNLDKNSGNGEVAVTFVNHATFLIQIAGMNILTDPVWSDRAGPFGLLGPKRVRKPGVAFSALPEIDLILISHNHYDHLDLATLKRISNKSSPVVLVPIGDKKLVESAGFKDVREFDWWESTEIGQNVKVTFTPTQHFSRRGLFDTQKSLWGSYLLQAGNKSIYFVGDSGYSDQFLEIKKRLGAPDIALLGIGSYEPRWFMQPLHMNPSEAVKAHIDLEAKQSIAMHFGTFQLSSESIDQPQTDLKTALSEAEITEDKFIVMDEGETLIYK